MIEIVNDDMPFLVDSVMAELTDAARRAAGAHPILAVERDSPASSGVRRTRPQATDEARESFIHIHVDHIEDARAAPSSSRRWSRC